VAQTCVTCHGPGGRSQGAIPSLASLTSADLLGALRAFRAAWARLYPGVLEWVSGSQGGRVSRVDTATGTVHTDFDEYKAALGDAIIATPMPKSAFSANNQAKVCAAAVVALLHGDAVAEPILMNTCYSFVAPEYGISIAGVYRVTDDTIVAVAGTEGTSPVDAPDETRVREAEYGRSWYANITADVFT
jgi:hypothetical protein